MPDPTWQPDGWATYSVPLAPVAATLPEGLRVALRLYAEGKTGWTILIGTIYV